MPPSHAQRLQHSMYALYRRYYSLRRVVLLRAADFEKGTVRIRRPGLYVLAEDIEFNPDPHYLTTEDDYSSHPMYSMGYFAAIAIECPGVILDLQGKTIRQSFAHYFAQRFFSVIELADSAFVPNEGPGSVNQSADDDATLSSATDCMILNGVIGLSSHSGIHGNNNSNVLLQNLVIRDFEVAGVQLNGLHNGFFDRVRIEGTACAPVASETFSLIRHSQELNGENAATYADLSGNPPPVAATVTAMVDALAAPFIAADQGPLGPVGERLKAIHVALQAAAVTQPTLARYVTVGAGLPDASAMYGVLLSSTGAAVNRLSETCAANGGGCPKARCPLSSSASVDAATYSSSVERQAYEVALYAVSINNIQLRSTEHIILQRDGTTVRDFTGAVLNVATLSTPPAPHELARAIVGPNPSATETATFEDAVQDLLFGVTTVDALIAGEGSTTFAYNGDVMAHVSKGCFGVRAEDTQRLCLEKVSCKRIQNHSVPFHPTEIVPSADAVFVSLTQGSPDLRTTYAFAGCDTRGVFVGNSQYVHMHHMNMHTLTSDAGLVRGFECDSSAHVMLHTLQCDTFTGRNIHGMLVQNDCRKMHVHNITANGLTPVKDVDVDEKAWQGLSEADRVIFWKRLERHAVRVDPRTFTCEAVPVVADFNI
jgi:hypothetical protein